MREALLWGQTCGFGATLWEWFRKTHGLNFDECEGCPYTCCEHWRAIDSSELLLSGIPRAYLEFEFKVWTNLVSELLEGMQLVLVLLLVVCKRHPLWGQSCNFGALRPLFWIHIKIHAFNLFLIYISGFNNV